ncbi:MAG: AbrB family transcriptional regulator [Betaproteobacteria bacterium]|nr:AbrB family transcriptional regulator [Betaproteobacteria bacterium]
MESESAAGLETRHKGDAPVLYPPKPSWESFIAFGKADADFLSERPDVIEEGRFHSTCSEYS